MAIGITRLGRCLSGLKYQAAQAPARLRQRGIFRYPETVARITLATPMAFRVLMKDEALQRDLADEGFNAQLRAGLQFRYYHGKGTRTSFGVHLSYLDDNGSSILLRLRGKEELFPVIVGKDERRFNEAHSLLFDPGSEIGRELLFRIIGIQTMGLEGLSVDEYSRVLGRLLRYQLADNIPLETISSITVVESDRIIDTQQDVADGVAVTMSWGQLKVEPWTGRFEETDPTKIDLQVEA